MPENPEGAVYSFQTYPPMAEKCPTAGCPGDARYAAPGRGHLEDCRYPVAEPEPRDRLLNDLIETRLYARLNADDLQALTNLLMHTARAAWDECERAYFRTDQHSVVNPYAEDGS